MGFRFVQKSMTLNNLKQSKRVSKQNIICYERSVRLVLAVLTYLSYYSDVINTCEVSVVDEATLLSPILVITTVRLMCGEATEFILVPVTVTSVPPLKMYRQYFINSHEWNYLTEITAYHTRWLYATARLTIFMCLLRYGYSIKCPSKCPNQFHCSSLLFNYGIVVISFCTIFY